MPILRMFTVLLVMSLSLSVSAQTLAPLQKHPEGLDWPTEAWPRGFMSPDVAATVTPLIDRAMANDTLYNIGQTRALIVIHQGQMVVEEYRDGFGPETKLISWSIAKSITHAIVGTAVLNGFIEDIDAPAPSIWPENDPRAQITWRQWLNMTDGMNYEETDQPDLAKNDVSQMMYGPGRFDVLDYYKTLKQAHEPGTRWNYSTGGFHAVAWAVQNAIGTDDTPSSRAVETMAYLNDHLFDMIGMDAQPEFDAVGTLLGGSLVYASAEDFAKFGYLYLRDGIWDGRRILPEGWVDFARTETPSGDATDYGAGFWITPPEGRGTGNEGASNIGPRDAFSAQGHEGQLIWIVPSRDLVIVRLGLMHRSDETWHALYDWAQMIAMAFPEVTAVSAEAQDVVPVVSD